MTGSRSGSGRGNKSSESSSSDSGFSSGNVGNVQVRVEMHGLRGGWRRRTGVNRQCGYS